MMIRRVRNFCILLALFTGNAALAADSGWTISEADGQVSITRENKAVYGAKGTPLQVGDIVRTGKGARAVLVRGDEFYVVSPKAQVRISKPEERGAVAQIFQSLGEMLSGIEQQGGTKPRLQQAELAAVVKGYGGGLEEGGSADADPAMNELNPDE